MKALLLTNEYPPHVYGGAGVHVEYLSKELATLIDVDVRCFGSQQVTEGALSVRGFEAASEDWGSPRNLTSVFRAVSRCVGFNAAGIDADVVHCHTWYTHLGGILAKLNYGVPLVITVHSLEPLRPWKREQLGGGYDFSLWVERTALEMADAIVAVSEGTRNDILDLFDIDESRIHIIHNGIDHQQYRQADLAAQQEVMAAHGVDPQRPFVLFVGRITRQKGIIHLVNAIRYLNPETQVVLCAGAPDTEEIAAEMKSAVDLAKQQHGHVVWIDEMLDKPAIIALYSAAAVFCCPSIYEPFGIINLEAMACEAPVVAARVGGIPEVVADGETGTLVPVEQLEVSPFEPCDPDAYSRDLATAINRLLQDDDLREHYASAGRARVVEQFGWPAIAAQTAKLYESLSTK